MFMENVFMVGAGNPIKSGDHDAEDWLKMSRDKSSRDSHQGPGTFS